MISEIRILLFVSVGEIDQAGNWNEEDCFHLLMKSTMTPLSKTPWARAYVDIGQSLPKKRDLIKESPTEYCIFYKGM